MLVSNRIIVIDDNRDDLNAICDIFHKNGIGCRGFEYDSFDLPDQPLTGVRFVFIDMNLNPAGGGDMKSSLKDAIKRFISEENGPYVLIFWTNRVEEINDFISFINRDDDEVKLKLKPLHISNIDKNDFLESLDGLEDKIDGIISSDIIKCIIKFDESVMFAARETLNRLLEILPTSQNWVIGESDEENTIKQQLFSKIAETTCGFHQAKHNPDYAIKESIAPIFRYNLLNNEDSYWREYLTPLQEATKASDLILPEGVSVEKLNSFFHIALPHHTRISIQDRGAVCTFVEHDFKNYFKTLFNISYGEWFSLTFPDVTKEQRKTAIPIAVEFSAACDFSQNKKRTNKYILGIICPPELLNNVNVERKGDYSLYLPFSFEYNSKKWSLGLNLNYTFTFPQDNCPLNETPIFMLTKELMDMIGFKYASHISRIGYTSF